MCLLPLAPRRLPVALEGALKMKEVSYVPSDAYAAGEVHIGWATLDMVPLFLESFVDAQGRTDYYDNFDYPAYRKRVLAPIRDRFAFILLDSPPSLTPSMNDLSILSSSMGRLRSRDSAT